MWADEGFGAGKGSLEVLGNKVNGECGEHKWNHLIFTLPLFSVDKGFSFVLSPLKHSPLELFLAAVASWLPYDDSRKWPNPESLPLSSVNIPSQNNVEPHPSI